MIEFGEIRRGGRERGRQRLLGQPGVRLKMVEFGGGTVPNHLRETVLEIKRRRSGVTLKLGDFSPHLSLTITCTISAGGLHL